MRLLNWVILFSGGVVAYDLYTYSEIASLIEYFRESDVSVVLSSKSLVIT